MNYTVTLSGERMATTLAALRLAGLATACTGNAGLGADYREARAALIVMRDSQSGLIVVDNPEIPGSPFIQWMAAVETILVGCTGSTSGDLEEFNYYAEFLDSTTPLQAAVAAINNGKETSA